ncbi:spermidine/putrescine ABC transporter substrate-binding protein [Myxococcota bacterium]|nr:spermidine/putrescine ABC transporter substrate-binding protein [Myxococcota bacterium]
MSKKNPVQTLTEDLQQGRLSRRDFVLQALGLGVSLSAVGSVLTACSGGGEGEGGGEPAPTPGADPAADTLEKELRIYIWSDYLAEDTVPNFEKEFGVKATVDTYESNEELIAKLQSGVSGYDLVCPSGYAITVLSALGLIEKLDPSRIPNLGNIAPTFRKTNFDPNDELTVPWQWGTTGVAYRKDLLPAPPDSWAIFHDKAHAGKMTMMDDMRDVIGAWLRFRGHSLNSKDPAQLAQAKADAMLAKANLQSFLSAPVKAQLISGDVRVAQLWNGDTAQAAAENDQIAFVLPKEGGSIWLDAMVMPKTAPNKKAAHAFLNYILRPEVGAAISNATGYGTPNEKAAPLLARPVPFPTPEELAKLEYIQDLGADAQAWDQLWTEIKAG